VAATSFGRYQLLDLLGSGGMGEVWRAHDTATERIVAVKLLPADLAGDLVFERRFRREARTAAGLNDPHVVPIHNYGEIDGQLYVDMRLIEGRDLGTLITSEGGRLRPSRAVAIVEQVATALDSAHRAELVHRDVKPSNILITERDFAYLIDFGIARATTDTAMTQTGHMIGTLAYMAPERFSGTTDPSADVYSLACVLHECLTGDRPFPGDSLEQQLAGHLTSPPPRPSTGYPDIPSAFDAVIARGLAKDPHDRYQTASELADAARAALAGPLGAREPSLFPQAPTQRAPLPRGSSATAKSTQKKAVLPPRATAPSTNEQRRAAAKRKLEQQLERQAEEARRRRSLLIVGGSVAVVAVIVAVVLIVANSEPAQNSNTAATTTSLGSSPSTTPSGLTPAVPALPAFQPSASLGANCQYPPSAYKAVKPVKPPRTGKIPTTPATVSATMATSQGNIGLLLANNESPCTVNNFASLSFQGFFNNTKCHRLTTSAQLGVLQCGDPKGDGTGGPGYQFANEYPTDQYPPNDPKLQEPVLYPRGTLAMANAGPNTNGSQFFLVYTDSQLPPQYTVFGTIPADGLATLDKIAQGGVAGGGEDGSPATEVTINSLLLD
jgi:eukaryotic-like serine/threonine-protein kinase